MIGQASFYGLYVPALMLICCAAALLQLLLRRVFGRVGVYRWVWHPALFDTAVFVILVYALSRASVALL